MQINCFQPAATVGYGIEQTPKGQLIPLYHRGRSNEASAFYDRWKPELQALPANTIQFLVAYSIAASGADPNFYQLDKGRRRAIWTGFNELLLAGDPSEIYAEHGLFALIIPTARQISGKMRISRADLLDANAQFAIAGGLAKVLLEKNQKDPLKTAIAMNTGRLDYAPNEFRLGFRGDFIYRFISAFNSYTEWQSTLNKETEHE